VFHSREYLLTSKEDTAARTRKVVSLVWLTDVFNIVQGQVQDYDLDEA
jgi:hypothetical protein